MKKSIILSSLIFILLTLIPFSVTAESASDYEITLILSFGPRSGIYTGTLENDLPHGSGSFQFNAPSGVEWLYEGEFFNGHFQGQGTLTSNSGEKQTGSFHNDRLHGKGMRYINNQISEEGTFADGNLWSGKKYCYYDGDPNGWDVFKDGKVNNSGQTIAAILAVAFVFGLPILFGILAFRFYKSSIKKKTMAKISIVEAERDAQINIMDKQFEQEKQKTISWNCPSCGASNYDCELCKYCGSGKPFN